MGWRVGASREPSRIIHPRAEKQRAGLLPPVSDLAQSRAGSPYAMVSSAFWKRPACDFSANAALRLPSVFEPFNDAMMFSSSDKSAGAAAPGTGPGAAVPVPRVGASAPPSQQFRTGLN